MRIVIVGDGKVGYTLTEQLVKEGHDVVVIDNDLKALQQSINVLDIIGIQGNGASYITQKKAGVQKADLLIASTSTDELNILCCMMAKKLGARHTIARVRNPEYAEQLYILKDDLGLSMTINPELSSASEISKILRFPSAIKIDYFAKGRVELLEFKINENISLDGQLLASLYSKFQVKILVCAVQRNEDVYIPSGDFILKAGDKVTITAPTSEIINFFKAIGLYKQKTKKVMIIGGGHITYYLAKQLIKIGVQVKIIEIDEGRCSELCNLLPEATIIHGDGTDQELLNEEGINHMDAFVALTDMDEENIIISIWASKNFSGKIITKINRLSYSDILDNAGIESVISPKIVSASQVIRYVRALQNSLGSNVETLHKIVDNQVEALEFRVRDNTVFIGKSLKELKLKNNLLIACIIREEKIIIPSGDDTIELNDSVVVISTKQQLQDLNDIIK